MSLDTEGPGQWMRGPGSGGRALMCVQCGTDLNLTLESITALPPSSAAMVETAYSCRQCQRSYVHSADVAAVAALLNRSGSAGDVLTFGGHYIHCGQLMQKTGSELRRLSTPTFTDGIREDALDVYLTTQVLHCPCGFQMELPE